MIAVGTGTVTDDGKNRPLAVKTGDRILFGKYSGSEVQLNGEDYDPTKVERVALQNAASIASLLLTTEVLITDIPERAASASVNNLSETD